MVIYELLKWYLSQEFIPLIVLTYGTGVVMVFSVVYAWQHVREIRKFDD